VCGRGCEARLLHTLTHSQDTTSVFTVVEQTTHTAKAQLRAQRAALFRRGTTLPPSVLFAFSFATPHASERVARWLECTSHAHTEARGNHHSSTPAHSVSRRRTSLGAACIRRSTLIFRSTPRRASLLRTNSHSHTLSPGAAHQCIHVSPTRSARSRATARVGLALRLL